MARLTDTNMTPAERAAFLRLQRAVGFSPKVLFGRDIGTNDPILQRVLEKGPRVLYALAVNGTGQMAKKGVREFRLLVTPVPVTLANGTKEAARPKPRRAPDSFTRSKAQRARIAAAVKKSWETRRAKAHATTTG